MQEVDWFDCIVEGSAYVFRHILTSGIATLRGKHAITEKRHKKKEVSKTYLRIISRKGDIR